MRARIIKCLALCTCLSLGLLIAAARAQTFRYEPEPRAGDFEPSYADHDPVPRMMVAPRGVPMDGYRDQRSLSDPRYRRPAPRRPYNGRAIRRRDDHLLLSAQGEAIPPGVAVEPFVEDAAPIPPGAQYEEFYDGENGAYYNPQLQGEPFLQEPGCGGCGHCEQCDPYGTCYMTRWRNHCRCLIENGAFSENLQLITGKQGFKGPVDQGINGDFGYHFAFNWGMPLVDRLGIGYQIGANMILSDFEGRSGPLGHRRTQWFVTTGAFRRVVGERGWQGGAVIDYLYDSFYVRSNLWQIRTQLSYVYCQHEIGYWGATHTNTSTNNGTLLPDGPEETFSFEGTDQYTGFYRYQFCNGTVMRTWAGLSGRGDGIFGGDATARISERLGLIAAYNYLLPRNHPGEINNVNESWNLTISFVWYPGYNRNRCGSWLNPYRPLFYTADNGFFFVRQN